MSHPIRSRALVVLAALILPNAVAPAARAQTWYPLSAGARWEYRNDHCSLTVTVQSPVELLGQVVWPVRYAIDCAGDSPFEATYYTRIDENGNVSRIGGAFSPEYGFWEFLPAWCFLQLPPTVGASWYFGYDDQVFWPAKKGRIVTWLAEEDISTPAGKFHVFSFAYASVAPGIGVVRQVLPAMLSYEVVDLVAYDLPVQVEPRSWSCVKALYR